MTRRAIVSVIGDSNVTPDALPYLIARELGQRLVDAGFRVMTGGLGGIMEAASRGAHDSKNYREGDTIGILPHADPRHANQWIDIAIPTGLDHARNTIVANADAVVAIGGGAGTLSEMAFAWIYKRLIVALDVPGWSHELSNRRMDQRIRHSDVPDDCVYGVTNAEQAVAVIVKNLPSYSARHRGFRESGR
jgi:uncharacterized protein (TIGR00725 family)